MDQAEALKVAIDAGGGYAAVSRALGLKTVWAVQKWKQCPAERVKQLVALSRGTVTAWQLRPDVYPEGFEFPSEMLAAALQPL